MSLALSPKDAAEATPHFPATIWRLWLTRRVLCSLFLLALIVPGMAAPGDVDVVFNPPNLNDTVNCTAVLPVGKILIGGVFSGVGGGNFLARINPDGKLDTGFTSNLSPILSAMMQADGKVVVLSAFVSINGKIDVVKRLNADGTLDTAFDPNANKSVFAAAMQMDGKIVIGGQFDTVNGVARNHIARLNSDGTLDTGFDPNVTPEGTSAFAGVSSAAVQADGKIIIGGEFIEVGGAARVHLARLNADGSLDMDFAPMVDGPVRTLLVQPDGSIVFAGQFNTVNGVPRNFMARIDANGVLDPDFDPQSAGAFSFALQADGKIVIGGDFTSVDGVARRYLARLNADGSLDPDFNTVPQNVVRSTTLQADGKIVIGGSFTSVLGTNGIATVINRIARLENDIAVQTLAATDRIGVEWRRGGAAPEVEQVTFELSTDGGANWSSLGFGTRVSGGWELTGLSLPASGQVRARGRTTGGQNNNSSGLVEQVTTFNFPAATVLTGSANGVDGTSAILSGTVNPNGSSSTSRFEYGVTTSYGSAVDVSPSPGNGIDPVPVSAPISNLLPNQIYHYRLAATNGTGTSAGQDMTFTTSVVAPTVTTTGASDVTTGGATISGTVNPNGSLVTSAVVEYGTSISYGTTVVVTTGPGSGRNAVAVGAVLTGLAPNQTYHFRVTATNAGGTSSGADGSFATGATPAAVTTGGVTNLVPTGVTLLGTVNPNGTMATAAFEYGETTGYGSTVAVMPDPGSGVLPVNVSAILAGLTPNRTYHYRLMANGAGGLVIGSDATFTTPAIVPGVITEAATDVTPTTAALHGTVDPNGTATAAQFEYGLTSSYGSVVDVAPAPGGGIDPVPVSATINNLLPNQTYHFRLVAMNSDRNSTGGDLLFSTAAMAPTVTTVGAANVTTGGAMISGTVNPNGSMVTRAVFEYGTTTGYGTSVDVTPVPGSERNALAVSAVLTGLAPTQIYHFRVTATNAGGTSNGTDATFETGATPAAVSTGGVANLTSTGVTLIGTVNPNGTAATAAFEYGETTGYGSTATAMADPGNGVSPVSVSAMLTGLTPNRTFHYRVVANGAGGLVTGSDATFTTPGILPAVNTEAATDVTPTTATLRGTVNPNGSTTTARFVYRIVGRSDQPTTTVNVGSGTSDIPLDSLLTSLEPFTNYEFRLESTNATGTSLGTFLTFKTAINALDAMPDLVFAAVGDGEFSIDALANDEGTGLFITDVIPGDVGTRALVDAAQMINFTPVDRTGADTIAESFSYRVRDVRNDPQFEGEAAVTVQYFTALRGTYYGNFSAVDGRVFRFRMDLDFAGAASGRFEWEDEQYPFKVQFNHEGQAQIAKARSGEIFVSLRVNLALDPAAMVLTGTFADEGASPETLAVTLQFLSPDPNIVPANGTIIAFIDPGELGTGAGLRTRGSDGVDDDAAEGIGFTRIKIKKGRAKFTTKMPDFGTFSVGKQRVQPSDGLVLPRYALGNRKIKRHGSGQVGTINGDAFTGKGQTGTDRIFGALNWTRNSRNGQSRPMIALVEGFRYNRPSLSPAPPGFTPGGTSNARIRLKGGGLDEEIKFDATLNRNSGRATPTEPDPVVRGLDMNLKIKVKAGIMSGSFIHPMTGQKVKVSGGIGGEPGFSSNLAIKEPRIRGSFFDKSTKRTGRITITPK